ncbi:MAG TPA: TVP38/TMEM64 family protein [Thermomicrobiales bacterium]|nr:TVP38/TMEM64 family protein [Thermomicrobiales bacterium]
MFDRRFLVQKMSRWQWRTWAMVLVLASIVAGVLFDAIFGRLIPLRPEGIREWLDGLGPWAPLVFIILLATAVVVSPIPSVPLDIAAGLAFGFVWGTVYVLIGAELGAIIAFLIARRLGRQWLARRLPQPAMTGIDAFAARRGIRALVLMRMLPVFNFDWVSYAAGLTSISFPAFALATLVGMIPPVMAIVAVGSTLPGNPVLAGAIFAALGLAVLIPLVLSWPPRAGHMRDEA